MVDDPQVFYPLVGAGRYLQVGGCVVLMFLTVLHSYIYFQILYRTTVMYCTVVLFMFGWTIILGSFCRTGKVNRVPKIDN